MTEETIVLARPVPASHASEIARRLHLVSKAIDDFVLLEEDSHVREVRLRYSGIEPVAELARKVNLLVESVVPPADRGAHGSLAVTGVAVGA